MNPAETFGISAGVPPLANLTVVVTRPETQSEELILHLESLGANVVHIPTIRIEPPKDLAPLEKAVLGGHLNDWVIFTSANGVLSFQDAANKMGIGILESLRQVLVCCIGPATAQTAESVGLSVSIIPETHMAEGVLDAFSDIGSLNGIKFLLPVAAGAREVLPKGLQSLGAVVDVVTSYQVLAVDNISPELLARLNMGIDLITFTSPSSAQSFHQLTEGRILAPVAVIGPVTSLAAQKLGYDVLVEAEKFTILGLVENIVKSYRGEI